MEQKLEKAHDMVFKKKKKLEKLDFFIEIKFLYSNWISIIKLTIY